MSHQKLLTKLESFRSRNSQNHCYINKDVYRLLYNRDFYYIAYMIARKCDISIKKVFKKYHTQMTYSYMNDKGEAKTSRLALYPSFKHDKTFFPQWLSKIKAGCGIQI